MSRSCATWAPRGTSDAAGTPTSTSASSTTSEILSGGVLRDGIPAIRDPRFISIAEADTVYVDQIPVVQFGLNGDVRAYPLEILTWHEIVADVVGGVPVAVTFCPLCNTAITFDRTIAGTVYDFGVSGVLRNSDLIMYDSQTESLWQQIGGAAIVGDMVGARLTVLPSTIVAWGDFKAQYPEGIVLSRETGYARRYGANPYVGYDDRIGNVPIPLPRRDRSPAQRHGARRHARPAR